MKPFSLFISLCVILFSCSTPEAPPPEESSELIRINQLGYYPQSIKEFLVADLEASTFQVIDAEGKVRLKGKLTDNGTWEASGEKVSIGDFSKLSDSGTYRILLSSGEISFPFEIKAEVFSEALDASIKSFYFQRASMAIEEQYGGIYQRASGHPDNDCPGRAVRYLPAPPQTRTSGFPASGSS